jgi:hypothetical protein
LRNASQRLQRNRAIELAEFAVVQKVAELLRKFDCRRRNVLLATVLVVLATGLLSSLQVYAAQLAWGPKPFPSEMVEFAFPLVARQIGGVCFSC